MRQKLAKLLYKAADVLTGKKKQVICPLCGTPAKVEFDGTIARHRAPYQSYATCGGMKA